VGGGLLRVSRNSPLKGSAFGGDLPSHPSSQEETDRRKKGTLGKAITFN